MPIASANLEPGVDYAVMLDADGFTTPRTPLRPLKATWEDQSLVVIHPEHPHRSPMLCDPADCTLLGEWNEENRHNGQTWAQLAAHALGQILRQHALVDRLTQVGIVRVKEPYIIRNGVANAAERSMVLNFDELDQLLTRAGV